MAESDQSAQTVAENELPPNGRTLSAKVEWSDDEVDLDLARWRKRKPGIRQKVLREQSRADRRNRARQVGILKSNEPSKASRDRNMGARLESGEDTDDDLLDSMVPEYLKQRRRKLLSNTSGSKTNFGLSLPPSYSLVEFSDDDRLDDLQERPNFHDLQPCSPYKDIQLPKSQGIIPAPMAQWLREYQVQGAAFLHELFVYQKGGILGDDMGLGKTVQVIACLAAAFGKTGDERDAKIMRKMRRSSERPWYPKVIIICPGSLMDNWKAEFQRWGWWHVEVFHGSAEGKNNAYSAAKSGRLEILLTTYTTYRLNKSLLNTVDWDCVIADECHIVKERRSEITIAMNDINALCRIGLTGTAIQNRYEELWTILNWTNPGTFGSLSAWNCAISEPLRSGQAHDATISQLAVARKTAKKLVNNLLPEFFLRRMKSLITDQLPKKSDRVVFCPLTETQKEAYESFTSSEIMNIIRTSSDLCECGSKSKRGWCCHTHITIRSETFRWQDLVFPSIITLQKISNHLALLIPSVADNEERQAKDFATLQTIFPDTYREMYKKRDNIVNFATQEFCGKWKVLKKLLQFWYSFDNKVLIFSHSVRLLKMLRLLFKATTTYNVSYLDGTMTYAERTKAVSDFNDTPTQFVFLISTRAGGVGLNITSANKVVVIDPNWNPSHDLQAQDRAYRIGQQRDVEVFRLISAGTIEEIVYARQIYKQQQASIGYNASTERRYFKGVQENSEKKGEIFGLANLFSFHGDQTVLRNIFNNTNVAESRAGVCVAQLDLQHGQNHQDSNSGNDYALGEELHLNNDDADDDTEHTINLLTDDLIQGIQRSNERFVNVKDKRYKRERSANLNRHDPIQAILAGAGVEYTHENSEVIGSSKIEARLSRHAERFGDDPNNPLETAFARSQHNIDQSASLPPTLSSAYGEIRRVGTEIERNLTPRYKYRPPKSVRLRQFCSMAKALGYAEPREFALVVENWTQKQRRECLDDFYRNCQESKGIWHFS